MTVGRCAAITLGAVALSACGSSGPGGLAVTDRSRLHAEVAAIRHDAESGQAAAARSAIGALRGELTALQRAGRLNGTDAARLQSAVGQAQAALPRPVSAHTAPPVTQSAAPAAPSAPAAKGHGKGHGHGNRDKHQGDGGD